MGQAGHSDPLQQPLHSKFVQSPFNLPQRDPYPHTVFGPSAARKGVPLKMLITPAQLQHLLLSGWNCIPHFQAVFPIIVH